MPTYRMTLEYDGTRYAGWQEQKNARTVAGEVRNAVEDVLRQQVELGGAGRTDAGVHALGQVAHLKTRSPIKAPLDRVIRQVNELLPADIAVLELDVAAPRFHARHDAVLRSYVYQIATRKSAFSKKHVWWIKDRLNVEAMQQAAALIVGRHDFAAFRASDGQSEDDSTIVVVESAEFEPDEALLVFRIEASHFIWRMVRRVVGVLVKVGLGEIEIQEVANLLSGNPGKLPVATWTAPSAGLFLESVKYREQAGKAKR